MKSDHPQGHWSWMPIADWPTNHGGEVNKKYLLGVLLLKVSFPPKLYQSTISSKIEDYFEKYAFVKYISVIK